jgi:large subunit ribosomal protein L24
MATSIRIGDEVQVISGRRNLAKEQPPTRGKVVSIDRARGLVTVEKYNLRTKHLKRTPQTPKGGRLQREGAISISRVMLVAADGKPVRLSKADRQKDGSVVRRPSRERASGREPSGRRSRG